MNYINSKSRIDDIGRITIPNEMLKKLGIIDGDILQITATDNLIVIEKCEGEQNCLTCKYFITCNLDKQAFYKITGEKCNEYKPG